MLMVSTGLQACTTSPAPTTPPTIASALMECDAAIDDARLDAHDGGMPLEPKEMTPVSTMNSPGHNGLSARSLMFNAITQNPNALRVLTNQPLNIDLFDADQHPYMSLQLLDSRARDVMADIVSCALDRSQHVSWVDPYSTDTYTWPGEMGLCPGWNTGRPSEGCLRLVSACLFARTNRLHRWVPARFGGPNLSAARDRIEVATKYSAAGTATGLNEGADIPAFSHGWQPGYIGRCSPGKAVELTLPTPPNCATTAVRLCSGIHGCLPDEPTFLVERTWGLCDALPVTFTCPGTGFFGVMTKPDRPDVAVQRTATLEYPAREQDIFPFLEGAFFGNIFDPEGMARGREVALDQGRAYLKCKRLLDDVDDEDDVVDAVPNRHIYACYSAGNDEQGIAYLNNRICATPGSMRCFPHPPRRCHFRDIERNQREGYHCKWHSTDGLYRECVGDDGIAYPSITVFLHEPCGLSTTDCATQLPTELPE